MKKFFTVMLSAVMAFGCIGMMTSCQKEENVIVVGVTDYAPMDYIENGKWTGFDAELAEKTFGDLGYTVKFQEIDWDTKIVALKSKSIDVIWNGMTVTDELKQNVCLSDIYLQNQQYGIVKVENKAAYTSVDSLIGKKVAVESGSAAQDALEDVECSLNKMTNQNTAVMEVAAGTSDVAVVDYTMAMTLTAEGSSYYGKLVMVDLGFEVEEFAIAFRQDDTALCASVNAKLKEYAESGYTAELAVKYGIENLLK